jgi:hypothetical protein
MFRDKTIIKQTEDTVNGQQDTDRINTVGARKEEEKKKKKVSLYTGTALWGGGGGGANL